MTDVVVCIPTFRRPDGLERCLRSLEALELDAPTRVIVADNDAEGRAGIATCERLVANGFRFSIEAIAVPQRGIAQARNALIAAALEDDGVALIAMIDDDEWAAPAWLQELTTVQAACDADVVGGPVARAFERALPPYVANANQPDYATIPTGPIDFVDATSNILFRADLFRSTSAPWFDPQYALTGGEDKDILLGFKLAHKTFAWAAQAVVTEMMPASRCSAKWMLQRAFRAGNTDIILNVKHKPPSFNWVSEAAKLVAAASVALANIVFFAWNPARRFEGLRLGARVLGKLAAIAGLRHQEYLVTHGK